MEYVKLQQLTVLRTGSRAPFRALCSLPFSSGPFPKLEVEARALRTLGKCSTSEFHPPFPSLLKMSSGMLPVHMFVSKFPIFPMCLSSTCVGTHVCTGACMWMSGTNTGVLLGCFSFIYRGRSLAWTQNLLLASLAVMWALGI